jgi:hypothetical protein
MTMTLRDLLEGTKDPSNLVTLTFALFTSYVIVTAAYNLYFHPLAKFPGPFWAKLSAIPSWYHTKNQNRHLWLLSLQEKYGALLIFFLFLLSFMSSFFSLY